MSDSIRHEDLQYNSKVISSLIISLETGIILCDYLSKEFAKFYINNAEWSYKKQPHTNIIKDPYQRDFFLSFSDSTSLSFSTIFY